MPAGLVRIALGWAAFLVLVGGVLLFVEQPGTAEFVVTVLTVGLGLLLAALALGAAVLMRHLAERAAADSEDSWQPAGSTPTERHR